MGMVGTTEQWQGWFSAVAPFAVPTMTGLLGFAGGWCLERARARRHVKSLGMADVITALNEVEGAAGDLKVQLSVLTVNDVFVVSREIKAEDRCRLDDNVRKLREIAGRLARFQELSKVADELAGQAAFVLHLGDLAKASGMESGQVTRARFDLTTKFKTLVAAKDRALRSIA